MKDSGPQADEKEKNGDEEDDDIWYGLQIICKPKFYSSLISTFTLQ